MAAYIPDWIALIRKSVAWFGQAVTQRPVINFKDGFIVEDDPFNKRTDITVDPNIGLDGHFVLTEPDASLSGSYVITAGPNVSISSGSGVVTISAATSAGSGDPQATYLVLTSTGSLLRERVLTTSGSTGMKSLDLGAGNSYTLSVDDNQVPFLTGAMFSGPLSASVVTAAQLTGSLTKTRGGLDFLLGGPSMSLVTNSLGQVSINPLVTITYVQTVATATLSASIDAVSQAYRDYADGQDAILSGNIKTYGNANWADKTVSYITIATTASLPNERALAAGTGISLTDAGAGGNATVAINNNVVATVSGTTFTGTVFAPLVSASIVRATVFSGSLTQLSGGLSYLVNGTGVLITSSTLGQVSIAVDTSVIQTVASGTALSSSIVATMATNLSASKFYADNNFADKRASYLTLGTTGTLDNERVFTAGNGLTATDAGANSTLTLAINNNVVATVSGTQFTGQISGSVAKFSKFSGSLHQTAEGLSYLYSASTGLYITSQSNGQVLLDVDTSIISTKANAQTVATTAQTNAISSSNSYTENNFAPKNPSYLVLNATASLPNERALSVSGTSGLRATDSGPGTSYTLVVDDNQIPFLSGATFTGQVNGTVFKAPRLTGSLSVLNDGITPFLTGAGISVALQGSGNWLISASIPAPVGTGADPLASYVLGASTASLANGLVITAGANVTVTPGAGTITIAAATAAGSGDSDASYIVIANTGSLSADRALAVDATLTLTDNGPNSNVVLSVNTGTLASVTYVQTVSTASTVNAVSQSLSFVDNNYAPKNPSYIVIGNTGSLPNERRLAVNAGLTITDGGANGDVTLSVNDTQVAMVSGTTFTGAISGTIAKFAQFTGSHSVLSDGTTPIMSGAGGIVTTFQANGQWLISDSKGASGGGAGTVTSVSASWPLSSSGGAAPVISHFFSKTPFYLTNAAQSIDPSNGTDFILAAGVLTAARTVRILTSSSGPRQSINMWIMSQSFTLTVVNNGPITGTIYTGSNGTPTMSKYFFDASDWNLDFYERLS